MVVWHPNAAALLALGLWQALVRVLASIFASHSDFALLIIAAGWVAW